MESEIAQLVEMVNTLIAIVILYAKIITELSSGKGATLAQARAALRDHKDVMTAAERIFDGKYDDVDIDDDMDDAEPRNSSVRFQLQCGEGADLFTYHTETDSRWR